ncbi:kinase-like domain-containing protein [Rhypophila decipiens]|uniref:Kinase-like domain-containing protein n=1 Tax=Rhypophila decipiens TaxID=261697 RepID=A0AAN6Y464_9PEZI|nr:kinase-like domain-containing protein [Rhypophila decipiens]
MRPRAGKSSQPPVFRSAPQTDPVVPPPHSNLLQVPSPTPAHLLQETFLRARDFHSGMILREKLAKKICGSNRSTMCPPSPKPERMTDEFTSAHGPRTYQRIFAVLVLLEKSLRIRRFIKEKVTDRDLPLTLRLSDEKMFRRTDKRQSNPLACFKGWSLPAKKRFEQVQWGVKAPYFCQGSDDRPVLRFSFDSKVILPFTFREMVGEGAHGVVFKVCIHEGHHGFGGHTRPFALKILKDRDAKALTRESMVPKLLSREPHPNILPLLATLEQRGKYSLLFESAETSLAKYWDQTPLPAAGHQTTLWLARECAGLARGLTRIHGPHMVAIGVLAHLDSFKDKLEPGEHHRVRAEKPSEPSSYSVYIAPRHGDLKAENLLLFPSTTGADGASRDPSQDYTIKISDFGLSGFDPIENPKGRITGSYAPPESETHPVIYGNLCDVWSLGCLYLEFIVWYFGGKELLETFIKLRNQEPTCRFFETYPLDQAVSDVHTRHFAQVKGCVLKFIRTLRNHERCTRYFSDFLDLIEGSMLVIDDGHLPHDPKDKGHHGPPIEGQERIRQNCRKVASRLDEMYTTCLKDEDYAFKSLNPNTTE